MKKGDTWSRNSDNPTIKYNVILFSGHPPVHHFQRSQTLWHRLCVGSPQSPSLGLPSLSSPESICIDGKDKIFCIKIDISTRLYLNTLTLCRGASLHGEAWDCLQPAQPLSGPHSSRDNYFRNLKMVSEIVTLKPCRVLVAFSNLSRHLRY